MAWMNQVSNIHVEELEEQHRSRIRKNVSKRIRNDYLLRSGERRTYLMAERRMFAKTIIDSDAFLDMPVTARLLYYDLGMRADDEGFVNNPKKIMRVVGATSQDLQILVANKFVIPFEDKGIIVIKHWFIHNYIRKDTFHETKYKEERAFLVMDENNAYSLPSQVRNESVTEPSTQVRLGKDSIDYDE